MKGEVKSLMTAAQKYVLFSHPATMLQCEVCHSIGRSCSGHLETCSGNADTCGIILHEVTIGRWYVCCAFIPFQWEIPHWCLRCDDTMPVHLWESPVSLPLLLGWVCLALGRLFSSCCCRDQMEGKGITWWLMIWCCSITGGMAIPSSIKTCVPSTVCQMGPVTMNYGKVKARSHLACCVGDACRTASVSCKLPFGLSPSLFCLPYTKVRLCTLSHHLAPSVSFSH